MQTSLNEEFYLFHQYSCGREPTHHGELCSTPATGKRYYKVLCLWFLHYLVARCFTVLRAVLLCYAVFCATRVPQLCVAGKVPYNPAYRAGLVRLVFATLKIKKYP